MDVRPSTTPPSQPVAQFAGRWALETGLSVGTGLIADAIQDQLNKKGVVPAAPIAIGSAALIKAAAKGAIAAADNAKKGRAWQEGVSDAVRQGILTGVIDATHSLIAPTVVAKFKGTLSPAAARTVTGAALWSANGAVTAATAPGTWGHGGKVGLLKVGAGAGTGAATGVITGALGAP